MARFGERIVTSFGKAKTSRVLISCNMVAATAARIVIWWRRRTKIAVQIDQAILAQAKGFGQDVVGYGFGNGRAPRRK